MIRGPVVNRYTDSSVGDVELGAESEDGKLRVMGLLYCRLNQRSSAVVIEPL